MTEEPKKDSDNTALGKAPLAVNFVKLLQGIACCPLTRVLHQDLKPRGMLRDTEGTTKLADSPLECAFSIPLRRIHEVPKRCFLPGTRLPRSCSLHTRLQSMSGALPASSLKCPRSGRF
ncbi:hypothetical protein HPB48_022201 [Haemaphysalis longicornis]|uniref:Uncharacterized protein n=1 Tax=Haemaphysalis longicornis TaxID=44386 RepID=A0A9J6FLF4_HAELO|nr:hypothetical protein HPB48_022201 [Haemaphysalis longicornis]